MRKSFDAMLESMLLAGVAPRHARRYIGELQEHLADIMTELLRGDCNEADAESLAFARLGEFDILTAAMQARPELRSWITLSSWRFTLLLPIASVFAVLLTECLAVAGFAEYTGPTIHYPWLQTVGVIFTYAGPFLGSLGIIWAGVRYRRPLVWTMPAIIVAALTGGVIDWHGEPQSIGFGLDLNSVGFGIRALPIMVFSLSAIVAWHAHRAKRVKNLSV